jgi:glucose-6-phosphate-specific signal transduction histidine kinase
VLAGEIVLTVQDDGRGLPVPLVAGVGLSGMRERAEELGGTLEAGAPERAGRGSEGAEARDGGPDGDARSGTRIRARIPLVGPSAAGDSPESPQVGP